MQVDGSDAIQDKPLSPVCIFQPTCNPEMASENMYMLKGEGGALSGKCGEWKSHAHKAPRRLNFFNIVVICRLAKETYLKVKWRRFKFFFTQKAVLWRTERKMKLQRFTW